MLNLAAETFDAAAEEIIRKALTLGTDHLLILSAALDGSAMPGGEQQ